MSVDYSKPFRRLAPDARPDVDVATGRATFVFNTEDVGRDGHVVRNAGIRTENYSRNPIVLFSHLDQEPPVGRATDINVGSPASKVTIEFTPDDQNPFGAMIGRLVKGRFLNAVSESWQPIKAKRLPSGDGYDFTEIDLLEISIVTIPALPAAIATARSRGIDTAPMLKWSERHLDIGGLAGVDRGQLLALRRAASGGFTADDGRAGRAVRARQIAERVARRNLADRIRARGASKLPKASREALERVQGHHTTIATEHGELSRRHARMARDVAALPDLCKRLKRAMAKDDSAAAGDALTDILARANGISSDHDGCEGAVADLGVALGSAQAGVQFVIDGLAEADEA